MQSFEQNLKTFWNIIREGWFKGRYNYIRSVMTLKICGNNKVLVRCTAALDSNCILRNFSLRIAAVVSIFIHQSLNAVDTIGKYSK